MQNDLEFQMALKEMRAMDYSELVLLQFQVANALREKRLKDVVFYFNNLRKDDKSVSNHVEPFYRQLVKEVAGARRAVFIDEYLDIVEAYIHID